jgi:hypothetical protein
MLSRLHLSKLARLSVTRATKCLLIIILVVSTPIYGEPSKGGESEYIQDWHGNITTHFELLGKNLCGSYNTDPHVNTIKAEIKIIIKDAMRKVLKDPELKPTKAEMVAFLNKHKNKLTCGKGKALTHYMAKAFNERVFMTVFKDLFETDLYKKDEYKIDYNSVTVMYNPSTKEMEPMTILDYIQKVALKLDHIKISPHATQNVKNIRGLIIRKFDGKFYDELTDAEREAALAEQR